MRTIAVLAGLAFATTLAGCPDSTPTDANADIRGSYRLEVTEGRALPDTIPGRHGMIVHGKVLEVRPEGHFTIVTTYQPFDYLGNKYGLLGSFTSRGTYRRISSDQVEFTEEAAGVAPVVARVSGARMEIGSTVYVRKQ